MNAWSRVLEVGQRQGGVVAVRQAVACGVPSSTFYDRVRGEGWPRPHPGVVLLPGAPETADVLARAALLAVGDDAVLTGQSALYAHGVYDEAPVRIHLVVPSACRAPRLDGVRVTRSRTLGHDDRCDGDRRWLARPARAFLDLAARTGTDRLRARLIDARQRRVVTVSQVAARVLTTAAGTPGRGRLLRACADVDASGADSALAAEVERRLCLEGFRLDVPPRVVAVPGRTLHPDLTLAGLPVAIEVDGFGTHAHRHALDLDQRKHNAYQLAGWTVLRVSWTRLAHDWDGFVAELRAAVAAASSSRRSA